MLSQESGALEDGQVLGDGRSALGEASSDLAGGHGLGGKDRQDPPPRGIGEGVEDVCLCM